MTWLGKTKTAELHTEGRVVVFRRTPLTLALDSLKALALFLVIAILWTVLVVLFAVRVSVESTVRDTHTTIIEAGLTLKNIREATAEWKRASAAQAQYSTDAAKQVRTDLVTANRLLTNLNAAVVQVNEKLIPQMTLAVYHADSAVVDASRELSSTAASLQTVVAALLKDADAIGATVSDPAIKSMLDNLTVASFELAESSKHLTAMLESGQATAQDVQKVADKVAYQYTKTRNLAYALFKTLLGLGGSAAQIVK